MGEEVLQCLVDNLLFVNVRWRSQHLEVTAISKSLARSRRHPRAFMWSGDDVGLQQRKMYDRTPFNP